MRRPGTFILCAVLCIGATGARSEDNLSPMERGAQLFADRLLRELAPALDGFEQLGPSLREFLAEMGPALGAIVRQIEDWSAYHPPEILPNGDIILRRKTEPHPQSEALPDAIDL